MAGDEGNRQFLDVERLAVTHGKCQWLVVRAPRDDRRVMTEQVDGFGGLSHGLATNLTGVGPLQRKVLPDEHAQLIGGVVQLGSRDVTVHA